jgi:tRNA1Val (adenine37-N6)-methyltransferase
MAKKIPLILRQPKLGYRYSVDAILLAKFIECNPTANWVDLGTGCAVIPILVALHNDYNKCYAIEMQSYLCTFAETNIKTYNLTNKISIIESDLRELYYYFKPHSFDFVASNPPYGLPKKNRLNPSPSKAIARYELFAGINDIVDISFYLLKENGFLYIIYPYKEFDMLNKALINKSLFIHKKTIVKDIKTMTEKFVLIKAGLLKTNNVCENTLFIKHNIVL